MIDRDALRAEVLRVHGRYSREVVEALGLCPWAAPARARGRVHTRVVFGREPALDTTLHEVESLEQDESADIGLIVFPELIADQVAFQHFAARVREAGEARHGRGRSVFALADFHPVAEPELASAERLVAFIRRTPDPTLQLLRCSVLDDIRRGEQAGTRFVDPALISDADLARAGGAEPLHQRVARANFSTVQRLGIERLAELLDDILRDRDLSYARLGVGEPTWSRAAHEPSGT